MVKIIDPGRIERIVLSRPITFNEILILKAVIEIDHINFGLDERTRKLKRRKRTNFSVKDVEAFILELDGDAIVASRYVGSQSVFTARIDCPVKGKFFTRTFMMILRHDHCIPDEIYIVTLYPSWE